MKPDVQEKTTIECLQHAIDNTQEVIRAYDIKAQILAALLTLIAGASSQSFCQNMNDQGMFLIKCSWLLCLITIFILGMVLKPKTNLLAGISFGSFSPKGTYHLHQISTSVSNTVSSISTNALATNWVEELTYESMKLSLIRDRKHCLFIYSLWPAAATIGTIFVAIIIGNT